MLSKIAKVARFSKISVFEGTQADVQGMENISKLPFYQSFREGLNLTMQNNLEEANKSFQQALNLLEDRKEQLTEHYMHIYKKYIPLDPGSSPITSHSGRSRRPKRTSTGSSK